MSPCRGCSMEYVDKNNDTCLRCAKRVKYVAALEGMSHSMPVEMTDMGRGRGFTADDDRRIMDSPSGSDSDLAAEIGRTLPSIWNRRTKLRRNGQKNTAAQKSSAVISSRKIANPVPGSVLLTTDVVVKTTPSTDMKIVNFKNFGEMYERLVRSAQKNFRTPEMQAMWFIHQGLLAESAAADQRRAADGP